jgi:Kef-type K+ transport system membrane component KefB
LIVVAKVGVAWVLVRISGLQARPLQLAVGLGQIGELSFVLASAAVAAGAIDSVIYVAVIAAVAVSIAVSSIVVRYVPTGGPVAPAAAAG